MAQTTGLVQRLTILPGTGSSSFGCVWIGATPTNTELLLIQRMDTDSEHRGAFMNSILDALTTAQVNRREVVAEHGDNDALITNLRIDPA